MVVLSALQIEASDGVTFYDLKSYKKHLFLHVEFYSNAKERVTSPIFTDFWMSKLEGQLQEYYAKGTVDFKMLIVVDNGLGHPTTWDLYEYTRNFYLSQHNISNATYVSGSDSNI